MPEDDALRRVMDALDRHGLPLLQDPKLPSVATLVAGEPVRGSWWGHDAGSAIFHASEALDEHPDVACAKLVSGKVTFVHRRLWPLLVTIGRAREAWQLHDLDPEARALLETVDAEGTVRAAGKPASALQTRLLVAARQVHTESGTHATELQTWARFAESVGMTFPRGRPAAHARSSRTSCAH